MALTDVIAHIDTEIAKLQQVRAILVGDDAPAAPRSGRGRPKGSKNVVAPVVVTPSAATKSKRKLIPEGRKAIADAMKRRWAERRKQVAK